MTPQMVSVIINIVFGILMALVGALWKSLKDRIDIIEKVMQQRGETLGSLTNRIGILESQFTAIEKTLDRIEHKIELRNDRDRERA